MVLPDNRYNFNNSNRRRRKKTGVVPAWVFLIIFSIILVTGIIFIITRFSTIRDFFASAATPSGPVLEELWKTGQYSAANIRAELLLQSDPLDFEVLRFNGFSYFYRASELITGEGNPEDSMLLLNRSVINLRKCLLLSSGRSKSEIQWILGKAYYLKQRPYYDLAIQYLRAASEDGFDHVEIFEYLGTIYAELEYNNQAIENFNRALVIQPDPVYHWEISKSYLRMNNYEEAQKSILAALEIADDDPVGRDKCRITLAEIYMRAGELDSARNELINVLETSDTAEVNSLLGNVFEQMGDTVRARYFWREALERNPDDLNAWTKIYNDN